MLSVLEVSPKGAFGPFWTLLGSLKHNLKHFSVLTLVGKIRNMFRTLFPTRRNCRTLFRTLFWTFVNDFSKSYTRLEWPIMSMGEYGLDMWSDFADHMAHAGPVEVEEVDPALADFFGSDQFCR